jgi:hypothetical protein
LRLQAAPCLDIVVDNHPPRLVLGEFSKGDGLGEGPLRLDLGLAYDFDLLVLRLRKALESSLMTKKGIDMQPRREFLKLAAFAGAAALTGKGAAAGVEENSSPQGANGHDGDDKMEFLRVSGRHIVDAKGNKVRLREPVRAAG